MSTDIQVDQQESKFEPVIKATLSGVGAGSRPVYDGAIRAYLDWANTHSTTDAYSSLIAYRRFLEDRSLSIGTINRHMSALRNFFRTARNMGAIPEEVFRRILEVKNIPSQGQKRGNWLGLAEAQKLLQTPDISTFKGLRDRTILAFMLGCGLRRSEVAHLRWDHIMIREGVYFIENLLGKHNRTRTIPMQTWVAQAYEQYRLRVGMRIDTNFNNVPEHLFWSVDRHGNWGMQFTSQAIWNLVSQYAGQCGYNIAPHDLRRTYAELMRRNGAQLEEVQAMLGHSSLTTTQHYLAQEVDPERVSRLIPMEISDV